MPKMTLAILALTLTTSQAWCDDRFNDRSTCAAAVKIMDAKDKDYKAVAELHDFIVEKLDSVNDDYSQDHVGVNPLASFSEMDYTKVVTAVTLHCAHFPRKTIVEAARVIYFKLLDIKRKRGAS